MVFYEWPGYGPVATTTISEQEWSTSNLPAQPKDEITNQPLDYVSLVPQYQPLDFEPLEEIPVEELSSLQEEQFDFHPP
ncbi:MAG: hypothetical protein HC796_12495 [Synechococcaceae cyanobacterium RL_1_2]|nr:hypothetical protein [Synechococcaceae cyanobacterium RL_1_2]